MPLSLKTESRRVALTFAAAFVTFSIGAAVVPHAQSANAVEATVAEATVSPNLVASGHFEGRSDHVTSGDVYIMKTSSGFALVLSDNFFLDGAPTPVLGFGNDGEYVKATQFADLEDKSGRQTYTLPADFNPADFNEIYVWCERFSIPLGVATLN